jgi:hypothetical protein
MRYINAPAALMSTRPALNVAHLPVTGIASSLGH